jgi:hypothetical protein
VRRALLLLLCSSTAWAGDLLPYDDVNKPPGDNASATATPTGGNDFRYKVLFKIDVNNEFDDASVSDASFAKALATQRVAAPSAVDGQAAALNARADYLSSDHVLGTEGLGWSHLRLYYHGFLLNRFEDYGGQPSATFPTAYLRGNQTFAYDIRGAYGEIDGFKNAGFWSKVYLRAGRQWRYGAGVATFDGLTLGYQSAEGEIDVWAGRRSPRFLDDIDPGFVFGLDGKVHLDALAKVPVDLSLSYLGFAGPDGGQLNAPYSTHHLLLVDGIWRIRKTAGKLILSLSSYDMSGMRGYLGYSQPIARTMGFKVFYDVKVGRDVTYDYISGHGFAGFSRFFYLPDQQPRSRIGVRWDHSPAKYFEYALFGNFNIVMGDDTLPDSRGWTGATAFDATYEEVGVIARFLVGTLFQPEAEYRVRFTQRLPESGLFSSTSEAGTHQFQEVRGDFRFRPAPGFSLLLGSVFRVYDWITRYAPQGFDTTVTNDSTVAGEIVLDWWLKRVFNLRVRYEIGTDSTAFAPELGVIQTLYATLGGRF